MAELSSQPQSIQSIYAMFRDEKLFVNRRYQRKLVWTLEEKQKLIESIQKKFPIPAILLAERENDPGSYEIIDGLQRLHAIISFIETSFPTLEGKRFDVEHFPTARSVADEGYFVPEISDAYLSQREVGSMLDYNMALSVMRGATEAEINDVFDRINTYGHRLSDQERRQAGVQNEFSNIVRTIACTLRGDESQDILSLRKMPSISIDLPMTKHGYEVQAEQVFWVEHGILRATDLRDSMDEQCIADITACIVNGELIDRSKDALDSIYSEGTDAEMNISNALTVYGAEELADEFKFCVDEIVKVCNEGEYIKLRQLIFRENQTNAFPSVFAVILLAFHELIVREGKKVRDYNALKESMRNIAGRIERGRRATSPDERRANVNTVKGNISPAFIEEDIKPLIYNNHSIADISAAIRRSEVELANYELKQGLLTLSNQRDVDPGIIEKVAKTICAIANNGKGRSGRILIGVTDKEADAVRVKQLDGVDARLVGRRKVVGVAREAAFRGIGMEAYLARLKDGIRNSPLAQPLLDSIMSNIDFNSYYGLGVIVISILEQRELSYYGDKVYWRNGDSTEVADKAPQIAQLARRF